MRGIKNRGTILEDTEKDLIELMDSLFILDDVKSICRKIISTMKENQEETEPDEILSGKIFNRVLGFLNGFMTFRKLMIDDPDKVDRYIKEVKEKRITKIN